MKQIISILIMALAIISTNAQDDNGVKTIFNNNNNSSNGGYGALMIGYSQISNKDAILIGGRGAWIIDHNFGLGIGGYGFMTDPQMDPYITNTITGGSSKYQINGGYGGLLLEPIIGAKKPVHLSIPILIGAGGIAYTKHWENSDFDNYDYKDTYEDSDAFFVIEPSLELEFNMIKFMRVALYASYRYTSNIDLKYDETRDNLPDPNQIGSSDMLRGMNYGIVLKFGRF